MNRVVRYALAGATLALVGCSQSSGAAVAASGPAPADWITRGAAAVRASNDLEDTRNCDYVGVLQVPPGWDGDLEDMTTAEEQILYQMKLSAVQQGGNFVLVYPGSEPSGEAYLCTE